MRGTRCALAGIAFLGGVLLADTKAIPLEDCRDLVERQRKLFLDLERIQQAAKDVVEIRETRAAGRYVLNDEEKKMERHGRMDLHIFMERQRNDTLEVLDILDRVLEKQEYEEPLRKFFGKHLDEVVTVQWNEATLEDVIDDLSSGYGVPLNLKGEIDLRKTMTLKGDMTLLSILLYIENVFDAKLTPVNGNLWFVHADAAPKPG